jgi:hypothetical protein
MIVALVSAGLSAAVLGGCAQPASDLDSNVAATLEAAAQQVRTDAAAGRYAEALEQLRKIETQANEAAAEGKLSASRKQDVLAAVALVKADLQALAGTGATPSATESTATPTPTPSDVQVPEPKKKEPKEPPGKDGKK